MDSNNDKVMQTLYYDILFIGKTSEMAEVAKLLLKRLKVRDRKLEEPD